jgi:hypothetical protein
VRNAPGSRVDFRRRRQDARELIYGQVLETAVENGVDALEAELLDWLAKTWGVRVQVLDEPTSD